MTLAAMADSFSRSGKRTVGGAGAGGVGGVQSPTWAGRSALVAIVRGLARPGAGCPYGVSPTSTSEYILKHSEILAL